MKKMLWISVALFILVGTISCSPLGVSDALSYEDMMQMAEVGVSPLQSQYTSLEEVQGYYLSQELPFAYTMIECTDVRYYVKKYENGIGEFITVYDIEVVELYETFLSFPWKKGDVLTLKDGRLTVFPIDAATICDYHMETNENGESRIAPGDYEWIPTKENVHRISYEEENIPLEKGERYVGLLTYRTIENGETIAFLNYETPVPEDCEYFVNDGYGLRREASFEKIAKELLDYVRSEKIE